MEFQGKKYPESDIKEVEAVSIFNDLIDKQFIKSFVNARDKIPNHDGNIEVIGENLISLGFIFVQVKGLNDNKIDPPKYSADTSFIGFCLQTNVPVLLIGVDCVNRRVYWVHINETMISDLHFKKNQQTKQIDFPRNNIIDGEDGNYISKWREIIQDFKGKLNNYDFVKKKYNDAIELINEYKYQEIGETNKDYINMHLFIDDLNRLLNEKFKQLKYKIFKNCWKVGLIYFIGDQERRSYSLYPIPIDLNDLILKKGSKELWDKLVNAGYGYRFNDYNNIFMNDPKAFARWILYERLKELLELKAFDNTGDTDVAKEYIIAFIDRIIRQLGLSKKEEYSIQEIENAYYVYFPIWISEAIKFIISVERNGKKTIDDCYTRGGRYLDPSWLIVNLRQDEVELVDKNVRLRIENEEFNTQEFIIADQVYSYKDFDHALRYLKKKSISSIQRLYKMSGDPKASHIYDRYTDDDILFNLKIINSLIPKVYQNFLKNNLLNVSGFNFFKNVSKVIVIHEIKNEPLNRFNRVSIHILYLSGKTQQEPLIAFLSSERSESKNILEKIKKKEEDNLHYEGEDYMIIRRFSKWTRFSEVFSDTPLMDICYSLLKNEINYFFEEVKDWWDQKVSEWRNSVTKEKEVSE